MLYQNQAVRQSTHKVLQAEQERIDGAKTLSVAEARKKLRERLNEV